MARAIDSLTLRARPALALLVIASSAMLLAACNTTEGVGEDIGAVGDAIDDAAEDAND